MAEAFFEQKTRIKITDLPNDVLCIIFSMVFDHFKHPCEILRLVGKKFHEIFYLTLKTYPYYTLNGRNRYLIRKFKKVFKKAPNATKLVIRNTGIEEKQKIDALAKCFPKITSFNLFNCYHFLDYIDILLPNLEHVTEIITRNVNIYSREGNVKLIMAPRNLKRLTAECLVDLNELFTKYKLTYLVLNKVETALEPGKDFSNLQYMKTLSIDYYMKEPEVLFNVLTKNCVNLREFKLKTIPNFTMRYNSLLSDFFRNCTQITVIDFSGNKSITDDLIDVMTNNLKNLTDVKLNYNDRITGGCLKYFARSVKLRILEIDSIKNVKNEDMDFFKSTPKIEVAYMSIDEVDDDTLISVFKDCQKLRYINLSNGTRITEKAVAYLLNNCIDHIVEFVIRKASIRATIFKDMKFKNYNKLRILLLDKIVFDHLVEDNLEFDMNLTAYIKKFAIKYNLNKKIMINTRFRSYSFFADKLYSSPHINPQM